MRSALISALLLLTTLTAQSATQDPQRVRAILDESLAGCTGACSVALLRDGDTRMVVGAGTLNGTEAHPDDTTLFEIGSITKVFTATLWRLAVERGECAESADLNACFGAEAALGAAGSITLASLACHRSGLHRLPANFKSLREENPYAAYTLPLALDALREWKLNPRPVYEYSNFGFGVLGCALEKTCKAEWPVLIRERIAKPLGLADTTVALSADQQGRLAQPRTAKAAVPVWDFAAMAGAGALKSTAADLLRFLDAQVTCEHKALQ